MTSPRYFSWRTAIEAGIAAGIATALSLIVFGPILGRMTGPLGSGDMLATYVNSDNWGGFGFATTTHYGFPLGMNLNYTPSIDITENAFAHFVNELSGSPFLGINLMLFLSFPLVAVLAYLLLRIVSRGGPIAIALAVAFTMIPYHFGRGLGHTYLATMVAGVTGVALATLVGMGYLPRIIRSGSVSRRITMSVLVSGLIVITAWSGLYYAAFAVLLTFAAVVWRIAQRDSWPCVGFNAIPAVAIAALALIGFLPAVLTTLNSPPLASLSERSTAESVTFAGNLSMAIVPAPISELPGMWRYNNAVNDALASTLGDSAPIESTALTNYGTWITTACLLLFLVGWVLRARSGSLPGTAVAYAGYLSVVTLVFFVPWGLNYVFANVVSAQIRAWNRLLPVLLLLFVVGAMAVLARTRWDRLAAGPVIAGLVILSLVTIDQVVPFRAAYQQGAATGALAEKVASDYAKEVNRAIPEHCGILQLPYAQYPEQGTIEPALNDYEHFMQALVNRDKDFSYGAVKNTEASIGLAQLGQIPDSADIASLREQGFCAIHVDRRGIPSGTWSFMEIDLNAALGPPVATGDDGLWQLFSLAEATKGPATDRYASVGHNCP